MRVERSVGPVRLRVASDTGHDDDTRAEPSRAERTPGSAGMPGCQEAPSSSQQAASHAASTEPVRPVPPLFTGSGSGSGCGSGGVPRLLFQNQYFMYTPLSPTLPTLTTEPLLAVAVSRVAFPPAPLEPNASARPRCF